MTVAAIARAIGKAFIAFADELTQPAATPAATARRDPHSTTAAHAELATPRHRVAGFAATAQAGGCLCGSDGRPGVHTASHCSLKPGGQP